MIVFFKLLFSKIIFQYYSLYHSTILFFLLLGSLSFEGNLQLPVHEPQIFFAVRRQYLPPSLGNTPLLSPMATLLNFKSNLIQKVYETQLVRYDDLHVETFSLCVLPYFKNTYYCNKPTKCYNGRGQKQPESRFCRVWISGVYNAGMLL